MMKVYRLDRVWDHHVSTAVRLLLRGRDVRWSIRTLWAMVPPRISIGPWSYEIAVGPWVLCYWHTDPPKIGAP